MVQDVSSQAAGAAINLLSEAGVVLALSRIRQGALSVEEKRQLRDLVFAYTTSGGDQGLRVDLEARLAQIVPMTESSTSPVSTSAPVADVTSSKSIPVVERSGFAGARPVPQFVKSTITPSYVPAPQPNVVSAAPVTIAVEPISTPVSAPPATPLSQSHILAPRPIPVIKTPSVPVDMVSPVPVTEPLDVPVAKSEPTTPAFSPDAVPARVVEEKLQDVAPVPTGPTVEMKPLYVEDGTIETYRKRIGEIKSLINTQVGNPVNLVDLDNEIGREYMTTLLEAMKAVSGGGGNMASAMQRLETTVVKVETLLKKQAAAPIATPVMTRSQSSTPPPVAPSTTIAQSTSPTVIPKAPYAPHPAQSAVSAQPLVEINPLTISAHRAPAPVASAVPLRTPNDLPTAADLKAQSGITDPLLDPDVDTGLDQLLSEWSIFKKSGIFGTGPHGRQHPLFIKLAPLTLSLIIAGRFEGATPEIRQSISDYMNGWRYEQGILFENDETFEHYLRRVIRHIIDSQTRRRTA